MLEMNAEQRAKPPSHLYENRTSTQPRGRGWEWSLEALHPVVDQNMIVLSGPRQSRAERECERLPYRIRGERGKRTQWLTPLQDSAVRMT